MRPRSYAPLLTGLAAAIREAVRPHLGQRDSRRHTGVAASGDTTFRADEIAEEALLHYLEAHSTACAYYSEDAGYVEVRSNPEVLLVIDPIDGTRPAVCGLEACVTSIALIPADREPLLTEVSEAIVQELPSGRSFYAARGQGSWELLPGRERLALRTTDRRELVGMFLATEFAGNPLLPLAPYLAPFLDRTSIAGGVFMNASSAFDLTRVANGQLDAFLAVGARVLRDQPSLQPAFEAAGRGRIVGLFPYDIAAAALIASEAGATVSDAYGGQWPGVSCVVSGEEAFISCVAAATPELHAAMLRELDDVEGRR